MKGYGAFLKKEFLEGVRTYRFLVQILIFVMLGVISPLTAKLLPEIISHMDLQGMEIVLPEPQALDSYAQFFNNLIQMGLVALVIVNSGVLSKEISKGTLTLPLTKGLGRPAVVLAKLTASILLWSATLLFSFGAAYGYTTFLFSHEDIYHLGFSIFCLWVFGCFLLSLLFLGAVLTGKTASTMLVTGGAVCVLFLLNLFPAAAEKSPLQLVSNNLAMLESGYELPALYPALGITCGLAVFMCVISIFMFRHKKYQS